ncbi:MAG TPA: invasin domain 3-containing protein [Longimicrobiales bacterium]|nr:invasin domain 3-containing protein [Longimicrobiales bacterium]
MSDVRVRIRPGRSRLRSAVLGTILVTACLTPTDGGTRFGKLHIRPAFPAGGDPTEMGIDIDNVRTLIQRSGAGDSPVVDTVMPFNGTGEQSWVVELRSVADEMDVVFELDSGSETVYRGTRTITVSDGSISHAELEIVDVAYVGPTRAHRVEIDPAHVVFSSIGDVRQLSATVYDVNGAVLNRPVEWSSSDPSVAIVDAAGAVTSAGVGEASVTAMVDGMSGAAAVSVDTLLARTASITASPSLLSADGTSMSQVTVVIRDAGGAEIGASAGTVVLNAPTLGMLDSVTDHDDGTYTATFTAGTTVGTSVITGTLDGTAIADSAIIVLEAGTADPSTASIAADSSSLIADGVSTSLVTVTVTDGNGNPVTGANVVFDPPNLGVLGGITDQGDGTYTATFTAGTVTGTAVITGTLNGAAIADSAIIVVEAGTADPNSSMIDADSSSLVADGASTSLVTVTVTDGNGNPVTGASVAFDPPNLGALGGITDRGDGTYTAMFTAGTVTGTAVITGTLNGAAIADSAIIVLEAGTADPKTATIAADSSSLIADGVSTSLVTVTVTDGNGNPVTGASVAFDPPNLGALGGITDRGDGTYTAAFTAGTVTGTAVIAGTLNGAAIADSAIIVLEAGPIDYMTTTISADSTTIAANGVSYAVITTAARDSHGNITGVSAGTLALQTTLGLLMHETDHGDGTYSARLMADTTAGGVPLQLPDTAVITGTLNGVAIADSARVELRHESGSVLTTTIEADSASLLAGISQTRITVTVRDAAGNRVWTSAGAVTLSSTLGSMTAIIDNGDGTYTARLESGPEQGTAVITGTLNGAAIADTAHVEFREESGGSGGEP